MEHDLDWRELVRGEDLGQVAAIATSIESMEYEARVVDVGHSSVTSSSEGPFIVQVRAHEWGELTEVLDQIIDEQATFDERLDARDTRVIHARRVFLMVMIVIVAVLALLGILEL